MTRDLPANEESYYDLFDDWDLIVSSLLQQYGVRIYSIEFKRMKWAELSALIAGIGPDTPLGRIVSIRAESDKDRIKEFTPDQKRIWSNWRKQLAGQKTQEDLKATLDMFKAAFIRMAGGADG